MAERELPRNVYFDKRRGKYRAEATVNGQPVSGTLRQTVEEAERDNLTVSYRLPMSLGELRVDKDNKGNVS